MVRAVDPSLQGERAMGNPFVHIELSCDDVAAAKKFYGSIFDWDLKDMEMGGGMIYTMLGVGKGTGGGIMKRMGPNQPNAWLPYVEVANVDATIAKARSGGAHIIIEHMDVGDMGSFGIF